MALVFEELRREGTLCDAVLRVQDAVFQVHKVIMCSCSDYFRALFSRWTNPKQRVYEVQYITPETMGLIIQFAYTGSFALTVDNMMVVMRTADEHNIVGMVQTCTVFMEKQLSPNNCIRIWQFTNSCRSPDLHSKAFLYILVHFAQACLSDEFLMLNVCELMSLFGRDDLCVRTETIVYESMMRWINHMPEERLVHLPELMSKIRIGLISVEYLSNDVLSNDLVKTHPTCQAIVEEARIILNHWPNVDDTTSLNNYFYRPRLPNAILLATGGWSRGDPIHAIEAYDARINRWVGVGPSEEQPRAYHGTAFLDGFIYFIGGFDRVEYFNSVRRFDPSRNLWEGRASMMSPRCYVSVTILDGVIYALGGFNGYKRLRTAECYKPQIDRWDLIAPMNELRSDASCAALQGKVYICGGFNGSVSLQSAEYYNPQTDQWTWICHMSSHRSGLGVVAYRDCIYAVGGNNGSEGNNRLRSAEIYDPESDTWTDLPPMITTRSNFGIEVVDDRIVVVGGFDGSGTCTAVESYDATLDEWTRANNMTITRSALSCCVLYGLPNMSDYTMARDNMTIFEFEDEDENDTESEDVNEDQALE